MYHFEITVHALPSDDIQRCPIELEGLAVNALTLSPEMMTHRMPVSFEDVERSLNALPRMFCEPDGSFVWVSLTGESPWQVDGNLFDRGGSLTLVDISGSCPAEQFDQLLQAFGWPGQPLAFLLVRQAVFLDEAEFRRYATQ